MIVLNDKDKSMIDESSIIEMYPKLSGYDAPELKYVIAISFRSRDNEKVYFYSTWDNAMHDRNQLIELVQARTLQTRG